MTEEQFVRFYLFFLRGAVALVLILVGINAIWFPDHEPVQGLFWGVWGIVGGIMQIPVMVWDLRR